MRYVNPMKDTPEGRLLNIVRGIEKSLGIEKKKDGKCSHCDGEGVVGGGVRDPAGQPEPCANCVKKAEKNSNCNTGCDDPECKRRWCPGCKDKKLKKYVQERSVDNIRPMFMEISGKVDVPATGYTGNQVLPHTEVGPTANSISEVFNMPSVSQTGYDKDSSSLHMHLTEGGGAFSNVSPIEDSLAEIKKGASVGQIGRIDEIAGLIEQIYARL